MNSMQAQKLVLVALVLVAGCGRVVSVDDSEAGANPLSTSDSGSTNDDAAADSGPRPELDSSVPSDPGTCAAYTPGFDATGGGHVGSGGVLGCNVATQGTDKAGFPSVVWKKGAPGAAALTGDVFHLSCDDGQTVLMAAVIRCFKGPGSYDVPAGALVLGGAVSDRTCRLDADTTEGELRGFISCDKEPADPKSIFSKSGPPIGLGTYAFPVK
jgi:uncharacterized protein YceK